MQVGQEETFDPVPFIVRVDSLDEAVELTHGSPFGNACSIFTESGVAAPLNGKTISGVKNSFYGGLHATGK